MQCQERHSVIRRHNGEGANMAEQKQTYTVLICGTDKAAVAQMKQALESVEWRIVGVATSENEALELARQHKPDIIVMALTLEVEQDGLAATRRILASYQAAVVIVSANTEDAVVEAALKAGTCAFLPSPLEITKFALALLLARSRFEALRDAIADASSLELITAFEQRHNEVFGRVRNALEVRSDVTRPKMKKRTEFIH